MTNARERIIQTLVADYEKDLRELTWDELIGQLEANRKMAGLSVRQYRSIAEHIAAELNADDNAGE